MKELKRSCVCSFNYLLLKATTVMMGVGWASEGWTPAVSNAVQGLLQGHARECGNQRVLFSEPVSHGCWQKERWLDVSKNSWLLSPIYVF